MDKNEIARQCAAVMLNDDSASRALGIDVEVTAPGAATARMRVRDDMVNGLGVCHGGLIFTLADTCFAFACNGYNLQIEDHRGRRTGYYLVKIKNQRDELIALFRGRSASNGDSILSAQSDT